ncbi:anaphase promoting complex subunit 4 [Linnemannia gamsii]|uniref:Anaphase-promoting complex subunit 4 n=1 Tax=Linnemannia gamsii TaxID=64522 RepID=A0ABQ7JPU8_9FUNG|nr:anaphase promoting complex subunit 4 [Linnemannia gamsii]
MVWNFIAYHGGYTGRSLLKPQHPQTDHVLGFNQLGIVLEDHHSIKGWVALLRRSRRLPGVQMNTQNSTLKVLPLLSPIPPTSAQQQMMERTMFNKNLLGGAGAGGSKAGSSPEEGCNVLDEETGPIMNVLFSGDQRGKFMLRLFEGFDMDTVSLLELLRIQGTKDRLDELDILKSDIQLNLSEITIIARGTHVKDGSGSESFQKLLQITLNSNLLDNHSREIRMLGLHKRPMRNLLQYLSDGLQVMKVDYKKISQMAEDCVENLQKSLTSNDVNTTPTYEFIQMLLTGRPSESMSQYLQQELNAHDLKRWDKSVKAAYKNLQRVAFEYQGLKILLGAQLEKKLTNKSLSTWCRTEQYGPLQLNEAHVYNCIIIVGDFMGMIEGLFQAIKVEMKQFSEFENWLEQVLEKLHPPARGPDDPVDDGQKDFPPVDVKGVSQYLKAGLTSNDLERFFQKADEMSASSGGQETVGTSGGKAGKADTVETSMQGYNATPSYPIVYSFSDDLRAASALKDANSDARPMSQKKPTNPFTGAAIAAAMAGRGFGSLPPKKSPSVNLFTKSSASTVQSPKSQPDEVSGSASHKTSTQLTLERHLVLMTKQCHAIFDGPQKALAESMRAIHVVEVLRCNPRSTNDVTKESTDITQTQMMPKFATRYCYNNRLPWHYVVVCVGPRNSISGSYLVVLRSRKSIRGDVDRRRGDEEISGAAEMERNPTQSSQGRKRKAPGNAPEEATAGSEPLMLAQPVKLSSTEPKAEQQPTSICTGQRKRNTLPVHQQHLSEHDVEAAIFSLQELDSAEVPSALSSDVSYHRSISVISEEMSETETPESVLSLAKTQSPHSPDPQPLIEVRDLTFLDDNSLCILLNSSRAATTVDNASHSNTVQDDQFVVSVPLLTPHRPYQPVSTLLEPSESFDTSHDCVVNKLIRTLEARSLDANATASSAPNTSRVTNVYTLPIDRSRCVTPLDGQTSMDVDGASRSFSFLKPEVEASLGAQQQQQQQDRQKNGPTRIACNDRDKGQVISVHNHNKISVLDV